MAEDLVKKGFNAGSGYGEVWIRDFNTFISLACKVNNRETIRQNLLVFFQLQQADGQIVDGFTTKGTSDSYSHYLSPLAPGYQGHKNTVETDQESSLVQAVTTYIKETGDTQILDQEVGGSTVRERMRQALKFICDHKIAQPYGLVWGATRADWGDVQPESSWGVVLDENSHKAICIYDNAMFLIAIQDYLEIAAPANEQTYWKNLHESIGNNTRKYLWDTAHKKFIPHLYLAGSPFPGSLDENQIYYHGGTTVAIQAGVLNAAEVLDAYRKMQEDVKASGAGSIGLTMYPPYPAGCFSNGQMNQPYTYQNGGDWGWFGARMTTELARRGSLREADEALAPMLERVIKNNGFYEWYSQDNQPRGSGEFRGEAGTLWSAIRTIDSANF